jgi:Fe-S-cluster containining protein
LCCKLLPVAELGKPAAQWCVHAVRGGGCGNYADRPPSCRQFFCAWRRDPNLGAEWKPDLARFVMSSDSGAQALVVTVDPGMPVAWKRQPYYERLKRMSEQAFRQGMKVLVSLRGHLTVILPDRDVPLGAVAPEEIVIWREGMTYAAALRRDLDPVRAELSAARPAAAVADPNEAALVPGSTRDRPKPVPGLTRDRSKPVPGLTRDRSKLRTLRSETVPTAEVGSTRLQPCLVTKSGQPDLVGDDKAPLPPPSERPAPEDALTMQARFRESLAHARAQLADPALAAGDALRAIMQRRNEILDDTADAYAAAGRAECGPGCTSCCYLMVMGTPWEIFAIARDLMETRTAAEIEVIRRRLQRVAEIPRDPMARVRARLPCGLLEPDGRCAAYGERPSVCRMTLSQSRAACDACRAAAGGSIPYIETPSRIAAVIQAGIDYALVERSLSVETAELSRALLVALDDHAGAMTRWLSGQDPFPDAHFTARGARSDRERALSAATRFGAT